MEYILYTKSKDYNMVNCCVCENIYPKSEIEQHLKTYHVNECLSCRYCKSLFISYKERSKHRCKEWKKTNQQDNIPKNTLCKQDNFLTPTSNEKVN